VRVAYADPPYPGMAHFYKGHPDYAGEVDHAELIARLVADYPDGWALSTASVTLKQVLALCPEGVRVGAWVKPFCSFKPGVHIAYAWEPVIFTGGRKRGREWETVRDWVAANITMKRGLTGAKPEAMCFWLFSVFGLEAGDTFVDLYPGSGAVSRAWHRYQRQLL
jgi:hypothetical protein